MRNGWPCVNLPIMRRGIPEVLAATLHISIGRETIEVLDLGAGSGSNLRGLAPHLLGRQRWRLIDHDSALFRAATVALSELDAAERPFHRGDVPAGRPVGRR